MVKLVGGTARVLLAVAAVSCLAACESSQPMTRTGEVLDHAGTATGNAIGNAGQATGNAVGEAGTYVKDKVQ